MHRMLQKMQTQRSKQAQVQFLEHQCNNAICLNVLLYCITFNLESATECRLKSDCKLGNSDFTNCSYDVTKKKWYTLRNKGIKAVTAQSGTFSKGELLYLLGINMDPLGTKVNILKGYCPRNCFRTFFSISKSVVFTEMINMHLKQIQSSS